MANSHPGSYCGQDAYSDMLVTEKKDENILVPENRRIQGIGTGENSCSQGLQGCNRPHFEGGCNEDMDTAVRRLTPTECARLQGFPDDWCEIGDWVDENGKLHKDADSPKYKALGNSICTPFWKWLARRICSQYERDITVGSLFSGIGGFEYVFAEVGAIPLWASEIEQFPIAVTKKHFGDEEIGEKGDYYNLPE